MLVGSMKRNVYGDDGDEGTECAIDRFEGDVAAGADDLQVRMKEQSQYMKLAAE